MARIVKALGPRGQLRAARELGWGRLTIRKGLRELDSGVACVDAFSLRGRKRAEDHRPNLLNDIRTIVDSQSQSDPQFRAQRLYTRLTAAEVRRQLIGQRLHRRRTADGRDDWRQTGRARLLSADGGKESPPAVSFFNTGGVDIAI